MDNLVETNSFLIDGIEPEYNLFFSKTNVYPMIKYEEQLQQINDYCYMTMHSFECKIDDLENYSSTLTEMHYEYEEFVVESWKDLADDIGRCTLLLLLLSFLETSLHEIAIWFCDEKGIEVKKHSRINNIVHYLQLIGECCNCDIISALESEMDILKMAINVRNKFVHKPWDTQFNRSKMFKLSEIINSLAKVFQTIEIQAISAGILHEDTFAF